MVFTDGIHLIAESVAELHLFANDIGLNKCWFHRGARHPHYDLMKHKDNRWLMLTRALNSGAIKVSTRELIKISRRCYFLPETEEEVKEFEERNKWELSQPLSEETQKRLDEMGENIINRIKSSDGKN